LKLPRSSYSDEVANSAMKAGRYGVFGEGEYRYRDYYFTWYASGDDFRSETRLFPLTPRL
jgi:hypothetical protein